MSDIPPDDRAWFIRQNAQALLNEATLKSARQKKAIARLEKTAAGLRSHAKLLFQQQQAASALIQAFLDKQSHDRCWYYPELLVQLAALYKLQATTDPQLPPEADFAAGCERFRQEQYHPQKGPATT